ncbi:TLC domain-containing protein 2 [Larimichthys crocea]|uniref:Uncharacterized protein n=1 Tax=Larimichthys crocea TaxID=215358 RepID=A0ACD3R471_LARCR|nr:TLC domain-containing protein 2 [Larimichthys crocea]
MSLLMFCPGIVEEKAGGGLLCFTAADGERLTRQLTLNRQTTKHKTGGQKNRPGTEITAPHPSVTYSVTSWLNLGTFLVFRVCTTGWMIHWLATHSELVPRYVLMMGTVGLSLISTMNMVLCYRLLRADILTSTDNTGKNH